MDANQKFNIYTDWCEILLNTTKIELIGNKRIKERKLQIENALVIIYT